MSNVTIFKYIVFLSFICNIIYYLENFLQNIKEIDIKIKYKKMEIILIFITIIF